MKNQPSKSEVYIPDTQKKLKVQKTLQKGIHEVVWESINGKKTMTVTLDEKYIPIQELPESVKIVTNQSEKGAEVVRAYSLDREAWRSFNVNDVVSLTKVKKNQ